MSAALDLHRRDLDAHDAQEDECTRFAEQAVSDQLGASEFFAWAGAGEATALLHDIIADDDQHQVLQLIIRAANRNDDLKRLAKPVIDQLYSHAYQYRQKELRP